MKTKAVYLILALCLILPAALATGCGDSSPDGISFPDLNLEAAIREAIGKPGGPINASDLEGLYSLNARDMSIADITGIEYCTKLEGIDLRYNNIVDVSPLANLTNLDMLLLSGNQISDIAPLENLTGLTWLSISYNNNFSEISALSNLANLEVLNIGGNQITDISPLSNLMHLDELSLDCNQITSIEPLIKNTGLSSGDSVNIRDNPLDEDSLNTYIPQLEARGVEVTY